MELTDTTTVERTTAITGAGFVVAYVASIAIGGLDLPDLATDEVAARVVEDSHRLYLSGWVGLVAATAFVVFAIGLALRLWRRGETYLGAIAAGGAAVGGATLASGATALLVSGVQGPDVEYYRH